jgi:hypothetical protein
VSASAAKSDLRPAFALNPRPEQKASMKNLSPRRVQKEEARRLGGPAGWYSTKISGTSASGPHASEADPLRKIAQMNPRPSKVIAKGEEASAVAPSDEGQAG